MATYLLQKRRNRAVVNHYRIGAKRVGIHTVYYIIVHHGKTTRKTYDKDHMYIIYRCAIKGRRT